MEPARPRAGVHCHPSARGRAGSRRCAEARSVAGIHDHDDAAVRSLARDFHFDLSLIGRVDRARLDEQLRRTVTARLHLRGINPKPFDEIARHAVGATLAQIEVVVGGAKCVAITFDREFRFRIALDQRGEFLQLADRTGLQLRAVIFVKRIARQTNGRAGTEGTFLREQRIQITETRRAAAIRPRAVAGNFIDDVWSFNGGAGGQFRSGERGLRTGGNGGVV